MKKIIELLKLDANATEDQIAAAVAKLIQSNSEMQKDMQEFLDDAFGKKILALLGLAPKSKPSEVLSAIEGLNKQVEELKSAKAQADADEKVIREKMSHGLTRDQAISVIKRQREHDQAKAKAEAEAKAKAKEAAGK